MQNILKSSTKNALNNKCSQKAHLTEAKSGNGSTNRENKISHESLLNVVVNPHASVFFPTKFLGKNASQSNLVMEMNASFLDITKYDRLVTNLSPMDSLIY